MPLQAIENAPALESPPRPPRRFSRSPPGAPTQPVRTTLREQVLSRVRRRERLGGLFEVNHDVRANPILNDDDDDVRYLTDQGTQRREVILRSLEAYTPAPPTAYYEVPSVDIEHPVPIAATDDHELVCRAIDACDDYTGVLKVTPEAAFLCPLSHTALREPVFAPDGHLYEKSYVYATKKAALLRTVPWCSPMTRARWNEASVFPPSACVVLAMGLWVKVKAVEIADAKITDSVGVCAKLLCKRVSKRE